MTTWQHSTPQTADASERDCLESLHRPRNESFSLGGLFLRLDDYRAGYRGSKKGRSVYLFTGLPRRVLLGNSESLKRGPGCMNPGPSAIHLPTSAGRVIGSNRSPYSTQRPS